MQEYMIEQLWRLIRNSIRRGRVSQVGFRNARGDCTWQSLSHDADVVCGFLGVYLFLGFEELKPPSTADPPRDPGRTSRAELGKRSMVEKAKAIPFLEPSFKPEDSRLGSRSSRV